MSHIDTLITDHLDLWSAAVRPKSSAGRGSNSKLELTGIKKLRELILELAVRGKLVPQDPSDEPASVLLERIAAEKARLVKEGKIKKPKALSEIGEEEKPFELPNGWEWARLNDLGDWGAGATPTRSNSDFYGGNIPWFKSGELTSDYIFKSEESVTELALSKSSLRYNDVGDVLVAMYGATIGKTAILGVKATTNQAVCACTPFDGFSNLYLLQLLKAYRPRLIGMGAGGAQPNISKDKIIATIVALPPFNEQKRIVSKIDELMALCDQLEQQSEAQLAAHQTLVETLLGSLLQPAAAAEGSLTDSCDADECATTMDGGSVENAGAIFDQNWARLSTHFDTLFTTEASIDALKQTILQLAVMGKLVPQDPSDEPAFALLERIAAEKAQLVIDKKIKKEKPLPAISEDDKPFLIPEGWVFARLQNVIDVRDGTHDSPKDAVGENTYPLITSKDFKNGLIDFENARCISEEDHVEISKRSLVEKYDILFSMIGGNIGNQVMVMSQRPFSVKNVALFKYFNKECTLPEYVFLYTQHLANDLQEQAVGGAQPFISLGALRSLIFPLPPVSEQHRIVAKVDELMTLCDQLKSRLQTSQQTQLALAESLVEGALA